MVTEKVHFFTVEYSGEMKQGKGDGTDETEDVEVREINFDQAFSMIASGEIKMLKQYAAATRKNQ